MSGSIKLIKTEKQ